MAHPLTIGKVAETTGVAAKTIRYYEEIGVLPRPDRSASGYRQYDDSAVERLRFIGRARSLGLPLRRLRALSGALNGSPRATLRPQLLALVQEQLIAVQDRIADLEGLRQQLQQVSRRMLTSTGRRDSGSCRCLEPADAPERSPRPRSRPPRRRPC